jgi:hypothetical protein
MYDPPIDIGNEEAAMSEMEAAKDELVTGFHIACEGDPSVGLFPQRWELEGDTYFNAEDMQAFKDELARIFEEHITGEPVSVITYEEHNKSILDEPKPEKDG